MIFNTLIRSLFLIALTGTMVAYSQESDSATDVASPEGPAITGADAPKQSDKPALVPDASLPPLPIEKTGNVETLPASYPESWMMVHELAFFGMSAGKMIVLDLAETKPTKRIKGTVDMSFIGNFGQSKTRNELYILETFHERGTRGPKTDVLAVYDKSTLTIKKEIVWPKPNRLQSLPQRHAITLSNDERLLYASNFDPAASFTVIDLDTHEIVEEISTAGCVLTYPVGNRSVASVCSNGAMLTTKLNKDGTMESQVRAEPFFNTDDTPIFENPVYVNNTAYFWSFKGLLHSFDMSGDEAKYLGTWDALSAEDKAGNWRPSGLVLNDIDDAGLIYTIFQPDGGEGTQTHGGVQVRVYDPVNQKLVRVIETPKWAVSIAVTRGDNPLLMVTNGELALEVYNAKDGTLMQTVTDFGNSTPLSAYKSY